MRALCVSVMVAASAVVGGSPASSEPVVKVPTILAFYCTEAPQTWTVPADVTSATFDMSGAYGGASSGAFPGSFGGGYGATATATFDVSAGEVFHIYVGCAGTNGSAAGGGPGGWNGGAPGGSGTIGAGGGGGGASDIRLGGTSLADRALIASGGGGAGGFSFVFNTFGGQGFGSSIPNGGDGVSNFVPFPFQPNGTGGTTAAGGAGGVCEGVGCQGVAGTFADGGPGGSGTYGGGGAGGGLYGGGGGAGSEDPSNSALAAGGGGAGSSFGPDGVTYSSPGYALGVVRILFDGPPIPDTPPTPLPASMVPDPVRLMPAFTG